MGNEAKHTPGPWVVEAPSKGCAYPLIIGPALEEVAVVYPGGAGQDANARLIAAAPELLEACEKALELLDTVSGAGGPTSDAIRAAVAQATGGCR